MNEEGSAALKPAHKVGFYPLVTITVWLNFLIGHNLFLCFCVDVTLNADSLVLLMVDGDKVGMMGMRMMPDIVKVM